MIDHRYRTTATQTIICLATLAFGGSVFAASSSDTGAADSWNLVIGLVVLAATLGSAVLNIAAIRQWNRNWGIVSSLPLIGLMLWGLIIVVAKRMDASAHALWQLEIFAWAMINMIYMVTAMTAKRMFARRDDEEAAKP